MYGNPTLRLFFRTYFTLCILRAIRSGVSSVVIITLIGMFVVMQLVYIHQKLSIEGGLFAYYSCQPDLGVVFYQCLHIPVGYLQVLYKVKVGVLRPIQQPGSYWDRSSELPLVGLEPTEVTVYD